MRRLFLGIFLWLAWLSAALAQYVTPVTMRDANLVLTNTQNFVTTLNTFSAQRTLTIPGPGALNAYYLQFVDTANAINGANTLVIQPSGGALINGAASLTVTTPGVYLFIVPSPSGYSATVVASAFATSPGGSSGQIQYNAAGLFGGFTTGGDATINTTTGILTLANVNSNTGTWGSSTLCAAVNVNAKGLITAAAQSTCTPAIGSITGLGTGVGTALATNVGTAGAFVVNGGVLGTPSSGTLTNTTGFPLANLSGAGSGVLTALGNALNGVGGVLGVGATAGGALSGTLPNPSLANPMGANKLQVFNTAGASGTYTTPTGANWLKITMIGGGAPGAGSGTATGTNPGNGNNTCVALSGAACTSPIYQAGGGTSGTWNTATGGAGGGCTGSGSFLLAQAGGDGGAQVGNSTVGNGISGPRGGDGGFGYGSGGAAAKGATAGNNGTGYGAGGQGGGVPAVANGFSGPGGGGGAGCLVFIQSPAASYTYAVSATSTGGAAGTNGFVGGNGSGGLLIFEAGFN